MSELIAWQCYRTIGSVSFTFSCTTSILATLASVTGACNSFLGWSWNTAVISEDNAHLGIASVELCVAKLKFDHYYCRKTDAKHWTLIVHFQSNSILINFAVLTHPNSTDICIKYSRYLILACYVDVTSFLLNTKMLQALKCKYQSC